MSLQTFLDSYIEAALWSSTGDDGVPLDIGYDPTDIAADARRRLDEIASIFYESHAPLWRGQYAESSIWSDDERAGHDLWLTRNGHGAGFWDRAWAEGAPSDLGARLTAAAEAVGPCELYVGDDGQIHC